MRSDKDPKNTIERLTNGLHHLATSTGTAFERYERAWYIVAKLSKDDFPLEEDRERFSKIFAASPGTVHSDSLGECIKAIWELYWRMSTNQQYR